MNPFLSNNKFVVAIAFSSQHLSINMKCNNNKRRHQTVIMCSKDIKISLGLEKLGRVIWRHLSRSFFKICNNRIISMDAKKMWDQHFVCVYFQTNFVRITVNNNWLWFTNSFKNINKTFYYIPIKNKLEVLKILRPFGIPIFTVFFQNHCNFHTKRQSWV
jgi:hypothetical protein